MNHQAIEYSVERLCNKGCRQVREDIAALEQGVVLDEVQGLGERERVRVLEELKAIMAVYGDSCRVY